MRTRAALLALFSLLVALCLCAQEKAAIYSLPDKKGALEIGFGNFRVTEFTLQPAGMRIAAEEKQTGAFMTVFVEPAPRKGNQIDCRNEWWGKGQKAPFKRENLKLSERGAVALVEYIVPEYQGMRLYQKNVHAYLAGGDLWVEVHMSKVKYEPADDALFDAVLSTLRMRDDYVPHSMDYFLFGSAFYRKQDYRQAGVYYQRALDMEKQSPQMNPVYWKVLVDNLGMSYGISGDLKRAKDVFEYGLTKDPEYPLFYYNLACTYAEMKDLDNALVYLQKAFEYRKNVLPGEKMPDPRTDDSFKRYLKDEKFRKVVDSLPQ